jgi:ABC-type multidrug transport system fused ATPase/permease subunit
MKKNILNMILGRNGFGGRKKDRIGDVYLLNRSDDDLSHLQVFLKSLRYLWPRNEIRLHFQFILSILFMILSSACELYAPIPMREMVAGLTPTTTNSLTTSSISFSIRSFILFSFATILNGCASHLRDMCFANVSAETERSIGLDTFRHLQKLSLSFHLRRETGAIIRSLSRGVGTYSALIKSIMFILLPMFIKLVVTCIIFAVLFEWYFFGTIIIFLFLYLIYSVSISQWRDKYRRIMNEKDDERNNRVFGKNISSKLFLELIFLI